MDRFERRDIFRFAADRRDERRERLRKAGEQQWKLVRLLEGLGHQQAAEAAKAVAIALEEEKI